MDSSEGAEQEDNRHRKTKDISSVVIFFRISLFWGTKQSGPYTLAEFLIFFIVIKISIIFPIFILN